MRVNFSQTAKDHLREIKAYIAKDSPRRAASHIKNVIDRIRRVLQFPYIGKVNPVYNREDIREIAIEGYKVIYQIKSPNTIIILVINKNIDLDESDIGVH